jgi:hypothetical protein
MISTFAAHMETVALALRGRPSSKHGTEWRYGTNGSLSIDIKRGTFFNHETKEGGGTLAFIRSEKPARMRSTTWPASGVSRSLRL